MKKQFKEIHILYAEDNPDEIVLMKEALNDVGQSGKLNVVRDGQEAIDYLTDTKNTRPDLMILDLNMPKVSGLEVLEFIKTNQKTKVIPVIIFTTSQSPDDIQSAYENYAACYIAKPMSYQGLKEAIVKIQNFWSSLVEFPEK